MAGTGEKNTRGGPKLALLPCSLILTYQGLEEENLDQKSPGPPGWGVSAAGQPPAHWKKRLAKKPIGNRRKRGRPKLVWVEGIRGLMGEKGCIEEDWNDRSNWRKKII